MDLDKASTATHSDAVGDAASPPASKRTCILVLGMHRSGTSALTRVLSLLGAALPKNVLGPGLGNDTGHWEPSRIADLNDELLTELGSAWSDWRRLDFDPLAAKRLQYYKSKIRRLIEEEYGDEPLFVLKEPRICRIVPLYRAVLEGMGIAVRPVLAFRNPLSVAASLKARNETDDSQAQLYWLRHVFDSEFATRGLPRAVVSYEGLLVDWRGATAPLAGRLGISWPRSADVAAHEIDTFLSADHQHHSATLEGLASHEALAGWIARTYSAVENLSRDPSGSMHVLDGVRDEFERGALVFGPALAIERQHLVAERERLACAAEAASTEVTRVQGELGVVRGECDRAVVHFEAARAEAEKSRAETEAARAEMEAARAEAERARAETEAACVEAARARAETEDAHAEAERATAKTESARLEAEQLLLTLDQERQRLELSLTESRTTAETAELLNLGLSARLNEHRAELDSLRGTLKQREAAMLETDRERAQMHMALVRAVSRPRAWISRNVDLEPINDLEFVDHREGCTTWRMKGGDPQFHVNWRNGLSLPPGHYVFKALVPQGIAEWKEPALYVDAGHGFTEAGAIRLHFRTKGDLASTEFTLPAGAQELRFDPSTSLGTLVLGNPQLRRKPRSEHYVRLISRAMRTRVRTSRDLTAALKRVAMSLRQGGVKQLASDLRRAATAPAIRCTNDYQSWIAQYDTITEQDRAEMRHQARSFRSRPRISVVMPTYNTPDDLLRAAIDSVLAQTYDNWELCIADDASKLPEVRTILARYQARDPRIKVAFRRENGHISRASNTALELATGDWVALLDHDDILPPHALYCVAEAINRHPDAKLIYSDEDKIDAKGCRFEPHFKSCYSPDLLRSMNYFNHLTVHQAEVIRAVGGWRPGFEGSQDFDLNLRIVERLKPSEIVHIPQILYHWRAIQGSTALAGGEKSYACRAAKDALEEHLERTSQHAHVEEVPGLPYYRVRHELVEPAPLVSLIIPTRDRMDLLEVAVDSILAKTSYPSYEILIVDNNSREPETFAYFARARNDKRVRVLTYPHEFNYSAINNFAVAKTAGTIVGLVNNDIEIIEPDWLTEMVSWAQQPRIGCVGALLHYPDGSVQHAGVITGIGGVGGHSHKHRASAEPGYFSRIRVIQNLSAVTAACLLVRKEVYEKIGGLDELGLKVAFNDVDFCLKVRAAGYLNVYTPFARLYHHESPSRGREDTPEKQARFAGEVATMQQRWGELLPNDPYYSPNLTLLSEDFQIAFPPRAQKPWRDKTVGRVFA
ncbi:MAG: glycosyltransferase [Hyphomicrobium sp.]|jgi:GT2 family glycosyltransferase